MTADRSRLIRNKKSETLNIDGRVTKSTVKGGNTDEMPYL